ncbi:5-(carboxyamino)imidazole ribonucleotide synthase [Fictibacillus sp. KIGAM418]|uniref:N5-carboxyaminoimidazole ribonucleotide synthase n=1 Tax=Fictibacillus marinisediminis TaxID=2878389 RepID=A0A9X1X7G8_9BACL|nr:5-(carboxyamino)imidazole ribonucleotide synthase [Fictibacillus marinisediminis]MCK6255364.1 5-(carboxyamino)imidazole ribonucleotide synthase [Fictibacillus marinisediminis]
MTKTILPGQTIGILGGGQLGRMMAISAREMGYGIVVLDPGEKSPCGQISDEQIVSSYDDAAGIEELAQKSDVITYEFENVDSEKAQWLEKNACMPQGSRLLYLTQHRIREKKAIEQAGVKVAPYLPVQDKEELRKAADQLGLPAVLKTCRGGYDGKGQAVIRSEADLAKAEELIAGNRECVLESWVSFKKELSVIVTRGTNGEMTTFPAAENIHLENILHQSIVPARISEETAAKAYEMAKQIALELDLYGTLAVEMFFGTDGEIYVNELAPRPHNSGHYTIEACETSQFQQHVRAVCGLPLGKTALVSPAVMINVLGEHMKPLLANLELLKDAKLHLYGKDEAKLKRKMGHITVLGNTVSEALDKAEFIKAAVLKIEKLEVTT